jgi:hypothetical protein
MSTWNRGRPRGVPDCGAVRSSRILGRAAVVALLAALVVPLTASAGTRKVPRGWLGVTFTPSIAARHSTYDREFALMKRSGVESVRVAVYWFHVQPKRHGRLDFSTLDQLVATAARHGLPLAPVVLGAPGWADDESMTPIPVPRDAHDYAAFMTRLAKRYGPRGSYWLSHPDVRRAPIRSWQVWNEVSNPYYWDPRTWSSAYPRLLWAAYDAVKAVDKGARVLMAGLNTSGNGRRNPLPSWQALGQIYDGLDGQGLGRPFDATAAHIYTSRAADAVRVMRETRRVMDAHGDAGRPADVTELSWPASKGKLRDGKGRKRTFFAETDQKGMASRLTKGVLALARQRTALNIGSVRWYQWISPYSGTTDAFSYSGLRRAHRRIDDVPALKAFRGVARRLEGRRIPR